jgi:hypothetical protein
METPPADRSFSTLSRKAINALPVWFVIGAVFGVIATLTSEQGIAGAAMNAGVNALCCGAVGFPVMLAIFYFRSK